MNMFEQISEFKPDTLFASQEFPVLKEGIGLKAGYGKLKRGSLIIRGADKAGYLAGTTIMTTSEKETSSMDMKVFGILTDDVDTGTDISADNIPVTVYQTGIFQRGAIIVSGENTTIETYEEDMKHIGIYLRNVQKYE